MKSLSPKVLKPLLGSNDGHALIIAGQTMNKKTGQCQFIVRNSWGTGKINCLFFKVTQGERCSSDGYIYLNAKSLSSAVLATTFYKKNQP